ncbi:MAG: tRNA (adenosine(37)-N6)-threonylcarbamoyltransferase complex ATPase subunit type 1 TsaE [Lachnospiraceae bacterium]|nr:tRNA (adenosine(37)-N6)-threonylcarbamoyltransferase complex ATPase subunit type 1 TsaE [Lachnospiraceae bacterium]
MVFESENREMTFDFGRDLGEKAKSGEVYALYGDLGTGKTVFAQGFAEGLGIREIVNSPTFTLLQVYEDGRLPLYHFDVYRLGDPSEAEEIGFEEYVSGDGVSLVEWADLVEELLPPGTIRIIIRKDPEKGADYRRIEVEPSL